MNESAIEEWDAALQDITVLSNTDFWVTRVLEAGLLFIVMYGIAKYVFMEKMFQGKKGKIYYALALIAGVVLKPINDDLSQMVIVFSLLYAMIMGRKKHRWVPVLMVFPWTGLADGIMLPIVVLPTKFMGDQTTKIAVYRAVAYGIIALLLVGFWFFGKKWRAQFEEEISNRYLAKWERILLCITGMLLVVFSAIITLSTEDLLLENTNKLVVAFFGVWFSVTCFVLTLTVIITVMVANRQAFYHDKVSDMQFNIIVMMAEIVENRDENTGGHIQRTAKYVEIIAKQLKKEGKFKDVLTDTYIKDMMVAAPLHDIGKIHVSDVILNKAGKLTDEEFEIMKSHAEEGRKLLIHAKEHLGDFSYLDIAVQMAGAHHEWWDGSRKGYPDQIQGEEIPLCARIMAVADVFDALTSKRCYKDPMPLEKAYSIIREEKNTHFDGEVVDAFFAASKQVEEALQYFLEDGERHCMGHAEVVG